MRIVLYNTLRVFYEPLRTLVVRSLDDEVNDCIPPIHSVIGGLHIYAADEATLGWTADKLVQIGVQHLIGAHCTGIEPLFRLRQAANFSRRTAVVGAVGASFILGEGIRPGNIAM